MDLILGVKEPPVDEVLALQQALPGKKRTYMVFSHTHKGQVSALAKVREASIPRAHVQPHNYNLLSAFLGHNWKSSLIDYELLTAPTLDKNVVTSLKRVAAFGWYAGGEHCRRGLPRRVIPRITTDMISGRCWRGIVYDGPGSAT